jgi:hypothetical protein
MPHLGTGGVERHRFAVAVILVSVGMVPWIVYLALTLPKSYEAGHWTLLWVGFDVGLVAVLVATALAAWQRRQVMVPLLLVTATLLVCDAWFDVVTSFGRPGGWVSIVTAVGAEIPLAAAFLWLYRRLVLATLAEARRRAGDPHAPHRLWDVPVLDAGPHDHPDT